MKKKKQNNGQEIRRPSWYRRFDILPAFLCLLLALLLWLVVVNTAKKAESPHVDADPSYASVQEA